MNESERFSWTKTDKKAAREGWAIKRLNQLNRLHRKAIKIYKEKKNES